MKDGLKVALILLVGIPLVNLAWIVALGIVRLPVYFLGWAGLALIIGGVFAVFAYESGKGKGYKEGYEEGWQRGSDGQPFWRI